MRLVVRYHLRRALRRGYVLQNVYTANNGARVLDDGIHGNAVPAVPYGGLRTHSIGAVRLAEYAGCVDGSKCRLEPGIQLLSWDSVDGGLQHVRHRAVAA